MRCIIEPDILIRPGEERDIETLTRFNIAMARETENKILRYDVVSSGVRQMLGHPEWGFYVVAETNGAVIGLLMVTFEWSDWHDGFYWWIQSVYVDPNYRRKGIYRSLYEHVKAMAIERNDVCRFRLYVVQENTAARTTYASLGVREMNFMMYEEVINLNTVHIRILM